MRRSMRSLTCPGCWGAGLVPDSHSARYRAVRMSGDPSPPTRMVLLRTVSTPFHARVIQARLGADGIVAHLRGNLGGPYPFGASTVWVTRGDAERAAELLLADEVESAFVDVPEEEPAPPSGSRVDVRRLVAAAGVALVVLGALAAHLGV